MTTLDEMMRARRAECVAEIARIDAFLGAKPAPEPAPAPFRLTADAPRAPARKRWNGRPAKGTSFEAIGIPIEAARRMVRYFTDHPQDRYVAADVVQDIRAAMGHPSSGEAGIYRAARVLAHHKALSITKETIPGKGIRDVWRCADVSRIQAYIESVEDAATKPKTAVAS